MDIEALREIDRWHIARIEEAKKKCSANPISFNRPGIMSPVNDDWENARKDFDCAIQAHTAWINGIFS